MSSPKSKKNSEKPLKIKDFSRFFEKKFHFVEFRIKKRCNPLV